MRLQAANLFVIDREAKRLDEVEQFVLTYYHKHQLEAAAKVAIVGSQVRQLLGSVVLFYRHLADGVIAHALSFNDDLGVSFRDAGYQVLRLHEGGGSRLQSRATPRDLQPGRIAIVTSGTTGVPKVVPHTWSSLFTMNRGVETIAPGRWLVPYLPGTYAWFQMVTLGMFVPEQTLIFSESRDPEEVWRSGVAGRVDSISSTPTFWRYLLLKQGEEELRRLNLKQITLGGEPIDQQILERLRGIYPDARITHIYASTEAGAAIVVHDRKEGFPLAWLDSESQERPTLSVREGKLWIRSQYSSSGIEGWYCTEDLVDIRNDRVVVIGRAAGGIVNVGGQKVFTRTVEQVLQRHPNVAWCKVFGKRAPITGSIVAAQLVLKENRKSDEQERSLTQWCQDALREEWMVPRLWQFLDEIPITDNMKSGVEGEH